MDGWMDKLHSGKLKLQCKRDIEALRAKKNNNIKVILYNDGGQLNADNAIKHENCNKQRTYKNNISLSN